MTFQMYYFYPGYDSNASKGQASAVEEPDAGI